MASWQWTPQYRLIIKTQNGLFMLCSLVQLQASLVTSGGVNQMTAILMDADGAVRRLINPQAMDVIRLDLCNRFGQWGTAWTGFVDTVTHSISPESQFGEVLQLSCTGPYKLWEITLQKGGDPFYAFAADLSQNVTGTSMLQYTAQQVGFPVSALLIDPLADSGSGYNGSAWQNAASTPELQSWSSVLQSFLANSGIEFFFNELGQGVWRRVGFLGVPLPRQLCLDEIMAADFSAGDSGVYTDIFVRVQFGTDYGQTGEWHAPDAMRAHLRERDLIVYAPWITANVVQADYLAKILGLQSAAGVLQGQITLPADPTIRVGSVITVPPIPTSAALGVEASPPRPDSGSFYYVHGVTYNLSWGGPWVMTLQLSYGRSRTLAFPYFTGSDGKSLRVTYPIPDRDSMPAGVDALVTNDNLGSWVWSVADPSIVKGLTLADGEVAVDSSLFDTKHNKSIMVKGLDGTVLGGSSNGYLRMVDGLDGSMTLLMNRATAQMATISDPFHSAVLDAAVEDTSSTLIAYNPQEGQALGAAPAITPEEAKQVAAVEAARSAATAGTTSSTTSTTVTTTATTGTVSAASLVYLARHVGIPEDQLPTAVAIALAESGGKIDAQNHNKADPNASDACGRSGSYDYGLWQINTCYNPTYKSDDLLHNPLYNAQAMADISSKGTAWHFWSTYQVGNGSNTWDSLMTTGRAAVAATPPGSAAPADLGVQQQTVSTGSNDPAIDGSGGSFSVLPVPTQNATITQIFGGDQEGIVAAEPTYQTADGHDYTHFHNGVDLDAPTGAPAYAVIAGKIAFAGPVPDHSGGSVGTISGYYSGDAYGGWFGFGNLLVLQSLDKKMAILYAHLNDFTVKQDDTVAVGQVVAHTGDSGWAKGDPHLHFSVFDTTIPRVSDHYWGSSHGDFIDPRTFYVKSGPLPARGDAL